ncbi:VOC family protein [Terrabacter sp. MAHUQ-38]|uniref:VOC family protein n=1 Tax=unclassified Terrabacter TaxID=2630222 RepID=UPI00165E9873|nr:VOC family protein [Terrabacter sp. MAHUQ-38]MBC9822890.1 VOC family protein [Terrabacter sp. MAHUQ-38]
MEQLARLASSVMFVAQLDRSVDFYRDVFRCRVAIRDLDAALLVTTDGFQIYLVAKGGRAQRPSGHIGLHCLMWSTDSVEALENVEGVLRERGGHPDRYSSGGVTFVRGHDPDGIDVVIAHPTPEMLPRSVIAPRLYN